MNQKLFTGILTIAGIAAVGLALNGAPAIAQQEQERCRLNGQEQGQDDG